MRKNRLALALVGAMILAGRLNLLKRFDRPVRCREGHVFTTIWMPLASLKSIRLGGRRCQRCPVGRHWSIVTPLEPAQAAAADLAAAAAVHDIRIP